MRRLYETTLGRFYIGDSIAFLNGRGGAALHGKVQLVLTSPPYPLNKKKSYGNRNGPDYRRWFGEFAAPLSNLLTPDGSIVIEMGNAWMPHRPVQSLLHLQALMDFVQDETAQLRLCQQCICYNPARLPSPAEWVTKNRMRLTDSFTHVWWMARTLTAPRPTTRTFSVPTGKP
jgi:site-specific DNA-methyltransferase (cytosine-N4-specific)